MPGLWGIQDLWDTEGNIRRFREDPSSLLSALDSWQAVAETSVRSTAAQFDPPRREFQVFTELLTQAAESLFGLNVPNMKHFEALCRGAVPRSPVPAKSPPPATSVNFHVTDPAHRGPSADTDEYWSDFDPDQHLVPGPEDREKAIVELKQFRDRVLAGSPMTPARPVTDQRSNVTSEQDAEVWLTVTEAADLVHVPVYAISKAAKQGTIQSRGKRRDRRVERESVLAWAQTNGRKKRERKKRITESTIELEGANERFREDYQRSRDRG